MRIDIIHPPVIVKVLHKYTYWGSKIIISDENQNPINVCLGNPI